MVKNNKKLVAKSLYKDLCKQEKSDNVVSEFQTNYDPKAVLERVKTEFDSNKNKCITPESNIFKAMTLSEFDNGAILVNVVPEMYKTFGINMLRQLQKDYNCTLISEKATAELVTTSYIRTLAIQLRLDFYLERTELNKADLTFIAILSKEQDRATRQYLAALQTLRMLKVPPLQFNMRADTAIIGQNQIIQENKNV